MQTLKRLFFKIKDNPLIASSINTMGLRIVGIVTLFGFTTYLAHHYDPKIIGQYDFIRTYLLVIGSVCILGTDQSILYFSGILRSRGINADIKSIYTKMFLLILIMSAVIFLLLVLVGHSIIDAFFNDATTYHNIFKATALLSFYAITVFNTEVFRALEAVYVAELFRNTFKYFSVIIGAIVLLNLGKPQFLVDTFIIGFVALSVISTVMILRLFRRHSRHRGLTDHIAVQEDFHAEYSYRNIMRKSYPMATSTLAIFLLMSFDVIFIKKHLGDESVAYYAIAVKLMTILLMVMNSVTITISTKISEYFSSGDMQSLAQTMRHSARLIFGLSTPIVLTVCFFADAILGFFGQNFLASKQALLILMLGQGVCSLFGGVQVYLNMTGRQHIFQQLLIVTVALNLLLNHFLVPRYGMTGGAISYVSSMFFWNALATLIIYKKDKINVFLS